MTLEGKKENIKKTTRKKAPWKQNSMKNLLCEEVQHIMISENVNEKEWLHSGYTGSLVYPKVSLICGTEIYQ